MFYGPTKSQAVCREVYRNQVMSEQSFLSSKIPLKQSAYSNEPFHQILRNRFQLAPKENHVRGIQRPIC